MGRGRGPGGLGWDEAAIVTGNDTSGKPGCGCGCTGASGGAESCSGAGSRVPSRASRPASAGPSLPPGLRENLLRFLANAEEDGLGGPGSAVRRRSPRSGAGPGSGPALSGIAPGNPNAEEPAVSIEGWEREEPAVDVDACPTGMSVLSRNVAQLGSICKISFGPSSRWPSLPELEYSLDPDYTRTASKKEVWSSFIPQWVARRRIKLSDAGLLVADTSGYPGLFWTDDFLVGAVKFALVTLHSYADFATDPTSFAAPCGVDAASRIRDPIANGGWTWTDKRFPWDLDLEQEATLSCWAVWLHSAHCQSGAEGTIVVNDGQVTASFPDLSSRGAVSPGWFVSVLPLLDKVWLTWTGLCEITWMNAALADYFFWWASRLLAWHQDSGDPDAHRMASVCVRAAMAEISELAGLLLHELTHSTGTLWTEDVEGDLCLNCCHYMLNVVLRDRLMAEFGAPPPVAISGTSIGVTRMLRGSGSVPVGRFDFAEGEGMSWGFGITPADTCSLSFTTTRSDFWAEEGACSIAYDASASTCWVSYDLDAVAIVPPVGQGSGVSR